MFRFHPEILVTQIRALLQAAHGDHRLSLMYPMIESIDQLRFVIGLVGEAVQSLSDNGLLFQRDFRQGVHIETPSAAWSFGRLLEEVDFASIGTNDLVQYLFAVERNTANVADLYQPEHPVALQIIHHLVRQAKESGKTLSVCGEMAADASMLPVLAGLGMRDLSVAIGAVATIRRGLGRLGETCCRQLAEQCLEADTVNDVRALMGRPPATTIGAQSVGEGEAVDPICGMIVQISDTPCVLRVGGVVHYFCSRSCLSQFINHPDR